MRTTSHIFILFFALLFCQCQDELDIPQRTNYYVTTKTATNVGNTSATIRFSTDESAFDAKKYLYVGTDIGLSAPQIKEGDEVTLRELRPGTTYYYQGVIEDRFGNQIKGDIRSFTTTKEPFSIKTGRYSQISSEYKYMGFEGSNGGKYNYQYNFQLYATLTNAEDVDSWGIIWFNTYTALSPMANEVSEGTLSGNFYMVSNSGSGNFSYQAYAKLKDGSYRLGEKVSGNYWHN